MNTLQKTAIVTLFSAAGFASAQGSLSSAVLSGVDSISAKTEVVWDAKNPVVNKNFDTSENYSTRSLNYRQGKRELASHVAQANIEIDQIVKDKFAAMLASNPALGSKLTSSASADAHFKVSVAQWGLRSDSRVVQDDVKPVVALRVDLVDSNGESLWHDYQKVNQYNAETTAQNLDRLLNDADSLQVAFNQAVNVAIEKIAQDI